MLGVSKENVFNWETSHTKPMVQYYPAIMDYLGYCPVQYASSLGERIRLHRTHQGLTISAFAYILGMDECTLGSWERSVKSPIREVRSRAVIQSILSGYAHKGDSDN
jgi:DNA-binding transcriptional regulator YiaG